MSVCFSELREPSVENDVRSVLKDAFVNIHSDEEHNLERSVGSGCDFGFGEFFEQTEDILAVQE